MDGELVRDKESLIVNFEDKFVGGFFLEGIYEDVFGEWYYVFGW